MDLKFALLADAVNESKEGKLNITGEFNTIWSPSVPLTYPFLCIVARFEARVSEGTQHTLRIGLFDEDGGVVIPVSPDLELGFVSTGRGRPLRAQVIIQLVNFVLPKHGDYEFHLLVDGHHKASVPLAFMAPPASSHGTG